ncbi:MAG: hypothetical protein GTN49_00195 [candidate division Zixibacteria bacterium]|nr:hypothetical protein [candidate division Zixibacteria bacterium]
MVNVETPPKRRWLYYVISFIFPLAGIVVAAIYLRKPDAACKTFGKKCLVAAVIPLLLCCVSYILHLVGVLDVKIFGDLASLFPRAV